MLRIGIDTGGTFTDFAILEDGKLRVLKLPSTPADPAQALIEGLRREIPDRDGFLLQHGSTVATNALLERNGAKTLLLTNQGFEDLVEIGRQNRPGLYKLSASRPEPLVPAKMRVGVKERTLWDGQELITLEKKSLDWLRNRVDQLSPESIAVCLLYSYLKPEAELRIAEALEATGLPVSLSHQVLPEFREYERTSATVINAYLAPVMAKYVDNLLADELISRGKLTVMQSNGGTISAKVASHQPVRTIFSGPAGGVTGAFEVATLAGYDRIITFDMGGTSTDVALCDRAIPLTREAQIDHQPVPIQSVAIHSVGAGGGSIVWVDEGGLLRVGPKSAGADPGPVCYGRGNQVTVTDAHILCGAIDPDHFLGGSFPLSPERVRPAFETLAGQLSSAGNRQWTVGEVAEGIRTIVNTQMESAIRVISLEKGYDTRDFTLVSYGGAGGLHACDLARALLIPRIIVPANAGLLSAFGILRADIVKDAALTVHSSSADEAWEQTTGDVLEQLETQLRDELQEQGLAADTIRTETSADLRYAGQAFEINVSGKNLIARFHEKHHQLYGYSNSRLPVEIVTLRVRAIAQHPGFEIARHELESEEPPGDALMQEKQILLNGEAQATRFYRRAKLRAGNRIQGPAIISEYSATTLVAPGFQAQVDPWHNLVIVRK